LRIYQSIGLPFLFVPINTVVYVGVPPSKSNQVSGIVNLARNMGGDIGIATVTTLIARRAQFHQARLTATADPTGHVLSRRMTVRYDVVAFDLYGTLLAVEKLIEGLKPVLGREAEALLPKWRKAQLERTWELNERGEYQPFGEVTSFALAKVAPHLSPAAMERSCKAWLTVPPHPDAVA